MKAENKRIFISDLPEAASEQEIRTLFGEYGKVSSVEIKERKELSAKNKSLFFGYVNIEIDPQNLQKCFQDFANNDWHGEYVKLVLAKESFLERLKREREEAGQGTTTQSHDPVTSSVTVNGTSKGDVNHKLETSKKNKNFSDVELNKEEKYDKKFEEPPPKLSPKKALKKERSPQKAGFRENTEVVPEIKDEGTLADEIDTVSDIVIKDNRHKIYTDKKHLKIESLGKKPVAVIDLKKKNVKSKSSGSAADIKRSQSLREKIKSYNDRQTLIKAALSNVDTKKSNRIVFDEEGDYNGSTMSSYNQIREVNESNGERKTLFDDSEEEEDDDFEADFNIKEIYEGAKGKELLKLQARYKNDKRFVLNEKFIDDTRDSEGDHEKIDKPAHNVDAEDSLEEEKKKEFEILSEILGKRIAPKIDNQKEKGIKRMIRYDPTNEEHAKYELKPEEPVKKKKKKKESEVESESLKDKIQEEKEQPVVSKEVFYKVTEDLKETLQESKPGFSLLSMFGQVEENDEMSQPDEVVPLPKEKVKNPLNVNPFKYDSSDEEDDGAQKLDEQKSAEADTINQEFRKSNTESRSRGDPFFFKKDDWRFQDGLDFIRRLAGNSNDDFTKVRRQLKSIVKSKVRNNQRKNKPFRKKLGGSAKKKRLRMKKALKR